MNHTYKIAGMTCDGCRLKVEKTLNTISGIEAKVTLSPPIATITMNEHVPIAALQKALSAAGNYTITDDNDANVIPNTDKATTKSCCNSDESQNKKTRVIEKVKNLIIDLIYSKNNIQKFNLSDAIANNIGQDYSYISSLFSQHESITIEHYYILQKTERVKELIIYDELSLSEIAFQLNYSSTSHLSKQFKKVTGITPTDFKNKKIQKRNSIDNL